MEVLLRKVVPKFLQYEDVLAIVADGDLASFNAAFTRDSSLVRVTNGMRQTALHIASARGHIEIAKALVKRYNADLTCKDIEGRTPLHSAVIHKSPAIARLLCAYGTDLHMLDNKNQEPTKYAQADSEIRWILEEGHDLENRDSSDQTALLWFSKQPNLDAVTSLLNQGADKEAKDAEGNTALAAACGLGHMQIARFLVNSGADLEAKNHEKKTPLGVAAEKGHRAIVSMLLEQHAQTEQVNIYGGTPLVVASRCGKVEVVRLLLNNGANVRVHNHDGFTALTFAAMFNHLSIVRLLLDKGHADINEYNKWGMTALCEAAKGGYESVAQELLAMGASLDAQTSQDRTPMKEAEANGHLAILDLLRRHCG